MKRYYDAFLHFIEKTYWIWFAVLTLMTAFLCFRCLGVKYIDSWDEARHGISAYEMMKSGNYLVNTYLGEPDYWNVKPPLSFWAIAAGFSLFGYTAVGLRFFSALSYVITCVCTGLYAKKYGKLSSLLTMAFLTANYFPFKAHLVRAGDADGVYLMLFTISMLAMLKVREDHRWLRLCSLCFSLAFLTKSFHAGMIAAVGGLFLLFSGEIRKMNKNTWTFFLTSAFLPILIWAILRSNYDGMVFFQNMYEADIAGRTAAGGLEGHGFPFSFYLTSIFWNFDYIYGWLSASVLLCSLLFAWSALRKKANPSDAALPDRIDLLGISLWLLIPLFGFSAVSTKLMWYVYPCIVPLCLLSGIFLGRILSNKKTPAFLAGALLLSTGILTGRFTLQNYLDNVRGVHSNALQTFIQEQFDRDSKLTGTTIYLEAYDPFLYMDTAKWEQNNRLLAMMEGDLNCQDGGMEAFLKSEEPALLILSIPFYEREPELLQYPILADNGQYYLIQKIYQRNSN